MPRLKIFAHRECGYVLIALSLSILFLLGMVGLAMDLGRMYVVRNESQSFCDSAAMFAANELNGTADGIRAAANRVTWVTQDPNGPQKRLEFGSREVQNITTGFATTWNATSWVDADTAAADPTNYNFVRVTTLNPVNLWFLPVLVSSTTANIAASAVAGRGIATTMVQGLVPFAPFQLPDPGAVCTAEELVGCSRDPNDQFGMVKGQWYTLRWLSGNLQDSDLPNFCPGDQCQCMKKLANISGAQSAGYAMYQGARDIRQAIVGTPPIGTPITTGSTLDLQNGQIQTEMNALGDRVNQDTDTTSTQYLMVWNGYPGLPWTTYPYAGNGRRIVIVVVQSAAGAVDGNAKSNTVVGFAGFFLGPSGVYRSGHSSTVGACGQYLGAFTIGVPDSGGNGNTVYKLRLYQ